MSCLIKTRKLCNDLYCIVCYEKSFASLNLKGIHYSPENELLERQIFKHKASNIIMVCENELCGHTYEMIGDKVALGQKCPFCCNPPKRLCNDLECIPCYVKSFASHPDIKLWSEKNLVLPRMCFRASRKKVIFNCDICNHDYKMSLNHFTSHDQRCSYCFGDSICKEKDCDICHKKSFASHPKSKYLTENNKFKASEISLYSHKIMEFRCDKNENHIFTYECFNIIYGHWCPLCKNKTEHLVKTKLNEHYDVEHQVKFDWCKNNNNNFLPFDLVIKNKKIIIEIDGEQHFKQISNWTAPEITRKTDLQKMKNANLQGYKIIRIFQLDIFNNKYDWIKTLLFFVKILEKYNNIKRIYISSNLWYNIYDNVNNRISIKLNETEDYDKVINNYVKQIENNNCELYIKQI